MLTGRRTDQIRAFSNSNGLAVAPDGTVDPACASKYDAAECAAWGASQEVNATFFDSLVDAGYNVTVLGKVDVGADVLRRYPGATETGYDGDELSTFTRSADIRKPTKFFETNQHADEVFSASRQLDWTTIERCVEWLNSPTPAAAPWLLYCSLNIPHPPFNTNATWLSSVNESLVGVPPWVDPTNASVRAHPYDAYMSISKAVDDAFTQAQIRKVRATYYAMCAETDYMLGRVLTAAGQRHRGVGSNTSRRSPATLTRRCAAVRRVTAKRTASFSRALLALMRRSTSAVGSLYVLLSSRLGMTVLRAAACVGTADERVK